MNQDQIKKLLANEEDFFIEKTLSVIDRATNTSTRFKLNKVQKFYSSKKTKFDIVLKSRKGGISTYSISRAIHRCIFKNNQRCVLLTQNDDATEKMFLERVKPILESCLIKVPYKIRQSEGIVKFPHTNSTFYTGTAGTQTFGRGSDITFFHLSEAAFYENPLILTAIEEALMDESEGVIETTANGMNYFYKLWVESQSGNTRYNPIFIPWFMDDNYRIKGAVINDLTDDERKLKNEYGIDDEQIAWRRNKIKNMSNRELFNQEYPFDWSSAFISSGRLFFDWQSLNQYEKDFIIKPKIKGYLKDEGETGVKFVPDGNANLDIYEMPNVKHKYIIGADVAEGIKDGAYSTAFVLDTFTKNQVAEYRSRISPVDFAEILVNLARYYNNAVLAPEQWPGPGGITCSKIVLDYRYNNVFKRQQSQYSHKKDEDLYGWETTRKTKQQMFYSLSEAIDNFSIGILSKNLLYELRALVHIDNKIEPPETGYSDLAIACAIAWSVMIKMGYNEIDITPRNSFVDKFISVARNKIKGYGVRKE